MRRVAVFRHGLGIRAFFMGRIARHLRDRGWEVRNHSYPTTRKRIEEHARDLAAELHAIAQEEEARGEPWEIHAVTHSMGALVLRYALVHCEVPPVRRAVLIVPPNRGSASARFFRGFPPFRWIFGREAAAQLAGDPPGIYEACGIPRETEIGIILGRRGYRLWPARLATPHDGVVSHEEMRLDDFPATELPYGHTPILFHRRTAEETARFLETGGFGAATG